MYIEIKNPCLQFNSDIISTYRQRGILIQLVFGSNSKARVVASSCPGQSHRCLQVAVHLLINRATELCAIITEMTEQ